MKTHYTLTLAMAALCSMTVLPSCNSDDLLEMFGAEDEYYGRTVPANIVGHPITIQSAAGTTVIDFTTNDSANVTVNGVTLSNIEAKYEVTKSEKFPVIGTTHCDAKVTLIFKPTDSTADVTFHTDTTVVLEINPDDDSEAVVYVSYETIGSLTIDGQMMDAVNWANYFFKVTDPGNLSIGNRNWL